MILSEDRWQSLEAGLMGELDARLANWRAIPKFEIHAFDIRRGTGPFAGMPVADRIAFRDAWMRVAAEHGVRLVQRSIPKMRYAAWCAREFGSGIMVNPHVAAFALLSRRIDDFLASLPGRALGILISDDNKETYADIEKSIRELRAFDGKLRLDRVIEKGFFIDSVKSLPLQLCDLFTLSLRKRAERLLKLGAIKSVDDSGIALAESLLHDDSRGDLDMIAWVADSEKKKRPGDKPGVG